VLSADASDSTRYEDIMRAGSAGPGDLASRFAATSRAARAAVGAAPGHEAAIREVAAGVAAPALVGFVLWLLAEARRRGLRRLRFLSRDGQVLHELTRRLGADSGLDLEYVVAYMYNTATGQGLHWRVPNVPFMLETFTMAGHGIVSGYRKGAGAAIRLLARPFTAEDHVRGDRAWIAGSLALSSPDARERYLSSAPEHELSGAPETDLSSPPLARKGAVDGWQGRGGWCITAREADSEWILAVLAAALVVKHAQHYIVIRAVHRAVII
jgi:hypothetical protein